MTKLGKYAAVKRPVKCPYCKAGPMGVRELLRHKRICEVNPYRSKGPQKHKKQLRQQALREVQKKVA